MLLRNAWGVWLGHRRWPRVLRSWLLSMRVDWRSTFFDLVHGGPLWVHGWADDVGGSFDAECPCWRCMWVKREVEQQLAELEQQARRRP